MERGGEECMLRYFAKVEECFSRKVPYASGTGRRSFGGVGLGMDLLGDLVGVGRS